MKTIIAILGVLLSCLYLSACSSPDRGQFSVQQICIGAIATAMGRESSIIKIDSIEGKTTYLSYQREGDGQRWTYRCKLEGDRVIWASDKGRWRTGQYDSKITFFVKGETVTITELYSDGSKTSNKYHITELSK